MKGQANLICPYNVMLSAIIRNKLFNHAKTMMNLAYILLSERSQSKKSTFYTFPFVWHSGKGKTIEMVKRSVVGRCLNR